MESGEYCTLSKLSWRIVAVSGDRVWLEDTRNKQVVWTQPENVENVWRPLFRPGDKVWSNLHKSNVFIITPELQEGKPHYRIALDNKILVCVESDLAEIKEDIIMDLTGGTPERYAPFVIALDQRKPAVMVMQESFNKLIETGNLVSTPLVVDGIFGIKTDGLVRDFQNQLGTAVDGKVGKNTWAEIIKRLPADWRPSLRFRLATLQDTYENGTKRNSFGAITKVPTEGWYNYGIWNVNFPAKWGGNISGSSLGILLAMAGRRDLYASEPNNPDTIASFLGTAEGRQAQLYGYFDQYILQPALEWLRKSGFSQFAFDAGDMPDVLFAMDERLLALSVDIAVNSGAGGYAPKRIPRVWDGTGTLAWDSNVLPDRDACIAIFERVFNESGENPATCKVPSPTQQYNYQVQNRDVYLTALRECLSTVCQHDWHRVNLIAELQGRCINPSALGNSTLQIEILKRRRSIARREDTAFQGTNYNLTKRFGLG